jgi:hypothetical protein
MRLNSQNPWGNTPVLQQARETIRETRQVMQEIEQGSFKPTKAKESDTAKDKNATPMSPAQMQAQMMVMMQAMQALTHQMSGHLNQFNQQFPNNALSLEAMLPWLFFQSLLNQPTNAVPGQNNNDSNTPAPNTSLSTTPAGKVEAALQNLLKTSDTEKPKAATNNLDEDDFTVSQEDINSLKASMDAKEFTSNDLALGLQKAVAKGTEANLDETVILFSKLMDQGVVTANQTLNPVFLNQLESGKQSMLVEALANAGVTLDSGKPNRATAGWILSNLDSNNEKQKKFAQALVTRMADVWEDEFDTPEGKQVKAFLTNWTEVLDNTATDSLETDTTKTDETDDTDAPDCSDDKDKARTEASRSESSKSKSVAATEASGKTDEATEVDTAEEDEEGDNTVTDEASSEECDTDKDKTTV